MQRIAFVVAIARADRTAIIADEPAPLGLTGDGGASDAARDACAMHCLSEQSLPSIRVVVVAYYCS